MVNFNFPELNKKDVEGKKCLVRVDFNVSFKNGKFDDDFRIKRTLPLLNWLKEKNARTVLITHIEENDGNIPKLEEFFKLFRKYFIPKINFISDITGNKARKAVNSLKNGDIMLLENLRTDRGEIQNDSEFSEKLASLGDLYINEAFSVSHRMHSSVAGIADFLPSYAGFNFKREVEELSRALNPEHPFLVFIAGKKISTKEKVIGEFLEKADGVVLGGMMAVGFYAALGWNVGKSNIEGNYIQVIRDKFLKDKRIILPDKVVVLRGEKRIEVNARKVRDDDFIYDVSPSFFGSIKEKISKSKLILWNGPFGFLEKGFYAGTERLAQELIGSGASTVVGGGDTVKFLDSRQIINKFSFVSTGGGAMLEFIANETLPGIEVLRR
ncbi:MAG: phosphoglycerate kinase [Candidatus Tagabacteria bacterium RIFCSPLOWO2_01_FULL_39_11]|uniref:Phosphoglycerate kinase n=1 Tax=Candidatus Tagabacteria bacterium RIFCSPLOWO2_01_FULL_39_11 TaxID=1802295 RepID=A0A1G2LR65_9BACT|nr:MAG: phosphoglycerate kinase [Candidatus Tagabacteria bacterium RIFCSPLOWO2_01_FULL_39_11]